DERQGRDARCIRDDFHWASNQRKIRESAPIWFRGIAVLFGGRSSMESELFDICCDRNPDPAEQSRQISRLLKAGADIHATDKNGVTALHHAVRFRSPTAVKTLIEHGANVDQACRRNGSTPLHRAVTQTGAPGTAGRGNAAREI